MTAPTYVTGVKVSLSGANSVTLTLGGPVLNFRGVEALSDGATYSWSIQQNGHIEWGRGIYSAAAGTLARGTLGSNISGQPIPISPGAQITFGFLAEDVALLIGAQGPAWAGGAIASTSANAIAVGPTGSVNPAFNIDASAASAATGVNVKAAAAGSGALIAAVSSGTNEALHLAGKGTGMIVADSPMSGGAPVTVTASTYTVAATDRHIIFNTSATCTVTFPAAATYPGRELILKNIAAFAINSASTNVAPLTSATPGTAVIAATAGKYSRLVSDGTNWVTMLSN